ncbi:MAG: ABC-F family ATP-binding cassette domain-containing protein [Desulfobacula sp.]|uniref:ABC-F family ATP-binding cassette domain-containing protein n=1 Tax=Desulfobacula sp. TaxID=2593537 RepID=UPI0025C43A25|nr:ABC-F family ATP-binding cassette domain-containing protein [Desulfobacula sp.]MCD4719363.1 ABC-F family ATP-binding cassette domain-containing protein [Desulfobacula sp.]
MLNIDAISKSFGDQILLDTAGFRINPGERVGLVGRNGHGKTTLLNMISGSDHPDEGSISCPTGYRIGFLSQKIVFTEGRLIDEAMLGLLEHEKDHSWKAEKILAGLGFTQNDLTKDPYVFSGGFQVRLNLAKVLVSEPDLLILDEPTNYLDITSIRWISRFLISWPREVLLVTHDRGFMDNVVTHIAGIHRHKIKKIRGDTSKYYLQVAQDEEVYEKTRQNEEKRKKEMELFISRFRAKARLANMVQSRIKTLEKSETKDKLQKLKNLEFSFNSLPFSGKQILMIENLSFGWQSDTPLINNFSLTVYPDDRIAVIGKNGKGKTTFLKLISGNLNSISGGIKINPGVHIGYFEQTNVQSLNDNFTVEDELIFSSPDSDRQTARNICGAMMFEKDAALKKISILSGGEKSRVMLGKLLMSPLNLLLLDEPSNHLDIEACDSFVCALDNFEGAVVIVTHNEMFLHSLANRLVVFKNNAVEVFEGTYQEFLDKEGWEDEEALIDKKPKNSVLSKKANRQKKSEIITQKSRKIKPIKQKIETLENDIENNEELISKTNEKLLEASSNQDGRKIQSLAKELAKFENLNEILFEELEIQMDLFEKIEIIFDNQLEEFER